MGRNLKGVRIAANSSTSTNAQCVGGGGDSVLVTNDNAVTVFVNVGDDNTVAADNTYWPVMAGNKESIPYPKPAGPAPYVAILSASGSASVSVHWGFEL